MTDRESGRTATVTDEGEPPSRSANRLLARLPPHVYDDLRPNLQRISVNQKTDLVAPHAPINKVYFLTGGVCSIGVTTADGRVAGAALVGNEGVIGLDGLFGDRRPQRMATVEIVDGDADAMDAHVFRREMS